MTEPNLTEVAERLGLDPNDPAVLRDLHVLQEQQAEDRRSLRVPRAVLLALAAAVIVGLEVAQGLVLGEFALYVVAIVAVVVVLGLVVRRIESRPCLRCGKPVQKGRLDCPSCGFDFRVVGQQ